MSQRTGPEPQKCTKCGALDLRKELLTNYGKYGAIGRGYRFAVYICRACGYSESYFEDRTIVKVF